MVAQNERIGAARMIIVHIPHRGQVAVRDDDCGAYRIVDTLEVARPAAHLPQKETEARALVEVQRRHGGLAPRALLGGRFVTAATSQTRFQVGAGVPWEEHEEDTTCPSQLWTKPFLAGLPKEFAKAVLTGIADERPLSLPPGTLSVDRAGFDQIESSTVIFALAAALLRQVLTATILGLDVEDEVRAALDTWT